MFRRRAWQGVVVAGAVGFGAVLAGCAVPREAGEVGGGATAPAAHAPAPATPAGGAGAPLPVSLAPATTRMASPELLALGKRLYEKQCAACHGADGRGEGEAAYLLYPKPRDFTAGKFALVSTWDRIPTDEDLYRTISRGIPGAAMPSWGHLSENNTVIGYGRGGEELFRTTVEEPVHVRPAIHANSV